MKLMLLLVPKVHLGVKKMWKKLQKFSEEIWRFLKKFREPTLSNLLLLAPLFSNHATRWQPSTTDSCKTLLILRFSQV